MADEVKKSVDESKEDLKKVFFGQLNKSGSDLIRNVISPKFLGVMIMAYIIISLAASIFRRLDNRCEMEIQLDKVFMGKMLCPVK